LNLRAAFLVVLAAGLATAACDDPIGIGDWSAVPDTVTVFSISRSEYVGRPSAFDFINGFVVAIDASPVNCQQSPCIPFDLVLSEQAGALVLLPSGIVEGRSTRAGIALAPAGQTFETLAEAPRDTAQYRHATPTPVQVGQLYIVRSRTSNCSAISSGFRYGKLEALSLDPARGIASFRFVRNPFCDDRALIPPGS
jgi:hypothetical protein